LPESQIPGWPVVEIVLDDAGGLTVGGTPTTGLPPGTDARKAGLSQAAELAAQLGRPVRARLTEPDGALWLLAVDAEGAEEVLEEPATLNRRERRRRAQFQAAAAAAAKAAVEAAEEARTGEAAQAQAQAALAEAQSAVQAAALEAKEKSRAAAAELPTVLAHAPTPATAPDDIVIRILHATDAGDLRTARDLCAQWQADVIAAHGSDHPLALRAREFRARLAALAGDTALACELHLELAQEACDRLGPGHPEAAAARAEAQDSWRAVTDPSDAARLGPLLLELHPAAELRAQLILQRVRRGIG
jgi:hypothetical protein